MTVTCIYCKQALPESSYYPSTLKKGWRICRKCQNLKNYKTMKSYYKRRKEKVQKAKEQTFDSLFGGYTITVLNSVKKGEFRYVIKGTNGTFLQTNSLEVFKEKIREILNRSQNA